MTVGCHSRRCQVASKYCPVTATIIGVDLMPIKPIPRVITHAEDITGSRIRQLLLKDLNGQKVR
jgi:AdoMet-dependent rRNA methyltransferase SPB1